MFEKMRFMHGSKCIMKKLDPSIERISGMPYPSFLHIFPLYYVIVVHVTNHLLLLMHQCAVLVLEFIHLILLMHQCHVLFTTLPTLLSLLFLHVDAHVCDLAGCIVSWRFKRRSRCHGLTFTKDYPYLEFDKGFRRFDVRWLDLSQVHFDG